MAMKPITTTQNSRTQGKAPSEDMVPCTTMDQRAKEVNRLRIEAAFAHICKTFFPRWNRHAQWRVCDGLQETPNHRIARGSKTILLSFTPKDETELHGLLIHEVCHAITRRRHDKKWLKRMMKAAAKAQAVGLGDLAEFLFRTVEGHARTGTRLKMMSDMIYYSIEDCVFYNPNLTCDKVIESVAFKWGFRPGELERNWKRCRRVYEEAVRKYSSW